MSHRVSLEGFDRSVLTQFTHMDAHVCATGGKCVVALPVYVKSGCCWEAETEQQLEMQAGHERTAGIWTSYDRYTFNSRVWSITQILETNAKLFLKGCIIIMVRKM